MLDICGPRVDSARRSRLIDMVATNGMDCLDLGRFVGDMPVCSNGLSCGEASTDPAAGGLFLAQRFRARDSRGCDIRDYL